MKPAKNKKHLNLVREEGCLICQAPAVAHHSRCIGPRTLGRRVSDYWTVPLCPGHHNELHSMKEETWWDLQGIDPLLWVRQFLVKLYGENHAERITP